MTINVIPNSLLYCFDITAVKIIRRIRNVACLEKMWDANNEQDLVYTPVNLKG
jgi:hypothetical protein